MSKQNQDFKDMSAEQLASKADELRRELFSLRLHTSTSVKDNTKKKKLRRDIARSLTFLNQKLNA